VTPEAVRRGERRAIAAALNALEAEPVPRLGEVEAVKTLVDALAATPRPGGQVVGLTGPPGVGKSTLAGAMVRAWRDRGLTVGVLAVDPTSRRSGGALLGDRARIARPMGDDGVFVRSMAARDRLGGLAPATVSAILVMRAAFDRVLVETVGVGQSETDVSGAADATVVIVQPASGDVLQFIKAGLMEVFDLLVVNKADLGEPAQRARRELRLALGLLGRPDTPILLASAASGEGVPAILDALDATLAASAEDLPRRRRDQLEEHAIAIARERYGTLAFHAAGGARGARERVRALPSSAPPSALLAAAAPSPAAR